MENELVEEKQIKSTLPARISFAVITPLLCFVIMEILESGTAFLSTVPCLYALLNIAFYALGYLLVLSLSRSTKAAAIFTVLLTVVAGIINYYCVLWRVIPLALGDFGAAFTVGSVLSGYRLVVPPRVITACIIALAYIITVFCVRTKRPKKETGRKMRESVIGVLLSAGLLTALCFLPVYDIDITGANGVHFEKYGYIVSFISDAKNTVRPPKGYDILAIDEKCGEAAVSESSKRPDVIVIMNESFADMSVTGDFETNIDVLPNLTELKKSCVSGQVMTFGLGGGTSLSEFEFLTRSSQALLSYTGVPYLQYMFKRHTPSLATHFKSLGYDITALHPAQAINYNRDKVYPQLDIDRFYDIEYFSDLSSPRGFLDDYKCYQRMLDFYDSTDSSSPQFIFTITMQNHGGYYDEGDLESEDVRVTSFDATYDVNRYLTLAHKSDAALGWLIDELEKRDRPVVLLFFGDHQPLLETEFYNTVFGAEEKNWTDEQQLRRHETPFIIWSSDGIEACDEGKTSLNYLGSILLEKAGLPLTGYDRFLLEMRKDIPAMGGCVYFDNDGGIHIAEKENNDWLRMYRMMQYNCLFDENKSEKLFAY